MHTLHGYMNNESIWERDANSENRPQLSRELCTLCPVLSEGMVAGVAMSNTELESPSETWACAASMVLDSSPNPYDCLDLALMEEERPRG